MNLQLQNKAVFVTGGTKGIGRAIAEAFYKEGARVVVSARTKEGLESWYEEISIVTGDLTKEAERERVFAEVTSHFGAIDILINNVGGSNGAAIAETPLALFHEAFELNFFSAVHFSKLVLPQMKKVGAGVIVNISSIFGRESGGKATYNSAKAALISFTKSLADEVARDGIRVNGVAPGAILHPTGNWQKRLEEDPEKINTFVDEQIPGGRFGTPEEIANVVLFLASPQARWFMGATVNVDGGQSKGNF
ncbi:SDR family NAD(P)-dependent oxidoreductase [Shouchella lonarensis]|uniref:3-oxoacyl-[acyl-carrier protein] reductase n=1 Tax=Shouchella lonarensis TaxID=1464122 RepID=A0A1G6GPP6_9BACI|nr:glucose 1-dehydrogenase [Shouchella lonarensis]SDB83918.1 3-oxoacyl-[acyl-carrier protein] reductase [Shouchella lonarensis]